MGGARLDGPAAFLAILVASVGCDHAAKEVARSALADSPAVSVAWDLVRLELVSNPGAFLSLGARLPPALRDALFLLLVPFVLAVLCGVVMRSGRVSGAQLVGLALVAGGGLANWLDRLLHDGAVTDFVSLGVGPLRTGIFNVADLAIVLGVAMLVLAGRTGGLRAQPGS